MRRQDRQGGRINIIEVIKDARLMRADELGGLRIAPMPGMTGEEDFRVGSDQRVDRFGQRHLISQRISSYLLCQIKITDRLRPASPGPGL